VHAIALANLGELASGLALIEGLDGDTRAILVGIHVRFHKKARGPLVAEARCDAEPVVGDVERPVEANIYDGQGDLVATVEALWRLSSRRTREGAV
jgi:acyl-coenzyme A thioesterase PaaI-like protein